jgi:hypothetical protein
MSAAVLQFPAKVQRQANRRMDRVELEARHRWMMGAKGEWENEQVNGAEYEPADPMYRMAKTILREHFAMPEPTVTQMRREIIQGRRLIERRNRVKRWLASLGVDLAEVKNPEQALFAAFDKLT